MTLQEAENLRQQNMAHTLRMPKCLQSISEDDMAVRNNIRYGICYLIKKLDMEDPTQSKNLLIRTAFKNAKGVNSFDGLGTRENPYSLTTKWGSGKFFNARFLFKNKTYPNYIEKRYCFSNCYYVAQLVGQSSNASCKVLSGIAYIKDYPILHTVIETSDGFIVDFNYDIAMEKSLYLNMFAFEPLNELTSQEIFVKDRLLTNKYYDITKHYGHGYRVFALDDLLDYAEQRSNMEIGEREPIKNF